MKKKIFTIAISLIIQGCNPYCVQEKDEWIGSVKFSNDGKYLFSAGDRVKIWDFEKGYKIHELTNVDPQSCSKESWFWDLDLDPLGNSFATANIGNSITFWDSKNNKEIKKIDSISEQYSNVNLLYSPNGKYLAVSLLNDSIVRIYDTQDWREIISLKEKFDLGISEAAFTKDGKYLFSAGNSRTEHLIIIWDYLQAEPLYRIKSNQYINSLKVSPDGKFLVSAGFTVPNSGLAGDSENVVKIWDINSRENIKTLKFPKEKTNIIENNLTVSEGQEISVIAFSKNGKYLALGIGDGTVKIINVENNWSEYKNILVDDRGNFAYKNIVSLSFSNNDNYLAVGGRASIIKIYDVKNDFKLFKKL